MGGEVLEFLHERAERLEREAEARGLEQGRAQGEERGIDWTAEAFAAQLRARGFDDELIEEVVSKSVANVKTHIDEEARAKVVAQDDEGLGLHGKDPLGRRRSRGPY